MTTVSERLDEREAQRASAPPAPVLEAEREPDHEPLAPDRPHVMQPASVLRLQAGAGNAAVAARLRRTGQPEARAAEATSRAGGPTATVSRTATTTTAGPMVQRSVLGWLEDVADDVGEAVGGAASDAYDFAGDVASDAYDLAGDLASDAYDVAGEVAGGAAGLAGDLWDGISGIGADLLEGAKALGSEVAGWLRTAGTAIKGAINWFGHKAWTIISSVGTWAFEKLALMGHLAWSFITKLPERLWRLVVDVWDGVTGTLGWLWTGLVGAAGAGWDAIVGTFTWLGDGLLGGLEWLGSGLVSGASWASDFLSEPTTDKLVAGLYGTLDWLGEGAKGLRDWGAEGLGAAAKWAQATLSGLAVWLWDGVLAGGKWFGTVILHLVEALGLGEALQLIWGLIFRMRHLTGPEIAASSLVHPPGLIPYSSVYVDEDSYLIRIGQELAGLFGTKTSPGAITTMHIIHAPGAMDLPLAMHELTHVAQYELIGAMYMPQALHAQGAEGYNYGDLVAARAAGKHFSDFNREQQASICEDYYRAISGGTPEYSGTQASLQPFIDDERRGEF